MNRIAFSLFLVTSLLFGACGGETQANKDEALARVYDRYLLPENLDGAIPSGLSKADSLQRLRLFVDNWIRQQLLLEVAERNLSQPKRIEHLVEEYRASLILDQYEAALLRERVDSMISNDELAAYYTAHRAEYELGADLVRCHFVKIKRSVPESDKLRDWFTSKDPIDFEQLKRVCSEQEATFILNEDKWVELAKIKTALPSGTRINRFLEGGDFLYKTTDDYVYLLRIFAHRDKEEAMPFSMVKDEISRILIYQRKKQLLQDLRKEVYKRASEDGNFEIFIP